MPEISIIKVGFESRVPDRKLSTPWGEADHVEKIGEGVVQVGTPSHGGIGVDREVAAKRLTAAARAQAITQGGRYWFEEDCDWAIVAAEFPEHFPDVDPDKVKESLERWNKEYLRLKAVPA